MNKHDGRNRSKDTQQEIRRLAIDAVKQNRMTPTEAAQNFKVSRQAIYKWIDKVNAGGIDSLDEDNRGGYHESTCLLTQEEMDWIEKYINEHTPDEFQLPFFLWTREAIQMLTEKQFNQKPDLRTISTWLQKWNFTFQKPAKKAEEQDPEEVKEWFKKEYPKIKRKAKHEKAEIYWGDESGIQSTHNTNKGFSKRGQTPKIKISGKRFRCNMISAIANNGKMRFKVFDEKFTGKVLIDFMKRLIKDADRKVILILDNHSVHKKSKDVNKWLSAHKREIEVFFLPKYSPELNPEEYLNNHLKKVIFKHKRAEDKEALKLMMRSDLKKIQGNKELVKSYFNHKAVQYARAA